MEKSLAVKYAVSTWWPSDFTPRDILKRTENICSYKTCTWMFTAALVKTAKKQSNQTSIAYEWMNQIWFIHNMAIIQPGQETKAWPTPQCGRTWKHHAEWKEPSTKATCYMTALLWNTHHRQVRADKNRSAAAQGWGNFGYHESDIIESDCSYSCTAL